MILRNRKDGHTKPRGQSKRCESPPGPPRYRTHLDLFNCEVLFVFLVWDVDPRQVVDRAVERRRLSRENKAVRREQLERRTGIKEAAPTPTHGQHRRAELLPQRYVGNTMARPLRSRPKPHL